MADIAGTNVAAPIRPFTDLDTFATALANEIKGGRHCVNTIADRNNIPLDRRLKGMHCYVDADSFTYELINNPEAPTTADSDWKLFAGSGSGSDIDWAALKNGPTASATAIDTAVADAHKHTNIALLETYTQTEANVALAVTNQHKHNALELLPLGGIAGQIPAIQPNGTIAWQSQAGVQATFGGEFATYADLIAFTTPQIDFSYIVTADESHGGNRTWYTYLKGPIWQYMGAFSDGMTSGGAGGTGGYTSQWNSPSTITSGTSKTLTISRTATFNIMPPSIMYYAPGSAIPVATLYEYDNGIASSFNYDPTNVEFVGTGTGAGSKMRLITSKNTIMSAVDVVGSAKYCVGRISLLGKKSHEGVVVA